jgi:hypothetical protein
MLEEKVKWPSRKKYPCKRNKGEHEYNEPVIIWPPRVRYIYEMDNKSVLDSSRLHPEYKFLKAEVTLGAETKCKHCGKKHRTWFREKL